MVRDAIWTAIVAAVTCAFVALLVRAFVALADTLMTLLVVAL